MRYRVCAADRVVGAELLAIRSVDVIGQRCRMACVAGLENGSVHVERLPNAVTYMGQNYPSDGRTRTIGSDGCLYSEETGAVGVWRRVISGFRSARYGWLLPYWVIVFSAAACASMPWLPWRFSLRTLLIATTLVAVVLGLIVWLR